MSVKSCKFCENTLENFIAILDEYAKLQIYIIFSAMLLFLFAKTRIPLDELSRNLLYEFFSKFWGEKQINFNLSGMSVFYKSHNCIYNNISPVLLKVRKISNNLLKNLIIFLIYN